MRRERIKYQGEEKKRLTNERQQLERVDEKGEEMSENESSGNRNGNVDIQKEKELEEKEKEKEKQMQIMKQEIVELNENVSSLEEENEKLRNKLRDMMILI